MNAKQIAKRIEMAVEDVRSAFAYAKKNGKTPAANYMLARAIGRADLLLEMFPKHEAWARLRYANY